MNCVFSGNTAGRFQKSYNEREHSKDDGQLHAGGQSGSWGLGGEVFFGLGGVTTLVNTILWDDGRGAIPRASTMHAAQADGGTVADDPPLLRAAVDRIVNLNTVRGGSNPFIGC